MLPILPILPILLSLAASGGPCPNAMTTIEVDTCLGKASNAADVEMGRYLVAARKRIAENGAATIKAFDLAQARWLVWRKAECDAVYTQWQGGTIRGSMYLGCRIALTQERTHQLWKTWLTYMDSTLPILPEPKLSADGTS